MTRLGRLGAMVALAGFAMGCGHKAPKSRAYPADVTGVVRLDGQPLEGGTITFVPLIGEEAGGRPGVGRIESDGRYRVGNANVDGRTGLKPGRYRVTVLTMRPSGEKLARLVSPERYADDRTTPLLTDVVDGANRRDFDLSTRDTAARDAKALIAK